MMRIVLTETQSGKLVRELSFERAPVKLGRDSSQCDIVFEQSEWPMVSRRHAEFDFTDGYWTVLDNSSSFGTFLNGEKIEGRTELETGSTIQLGLNGPLLTVSELASEEKLIESKKIARLDFVTEDESSRPPFILHKERVLIGRDPGSSLRIDADAAIVSRRHAEIGFDEGEYYILDLNSFNGTLVNERRIAAQTQLVDGDLIQLGPGGPKLRFSGPQNQTSNERRETARSSPDLNQTLVLRNGVGRPVELKAVERNELVKIPFTSADISIGRSPENEIQLDGLIISNHHARFIKRDNQIFVRDSGSTNGVYVNGARISVEQSIGADDIVQIGPFLLKASLEEGVRVYDNRSKTGLEAREITRRSLDKEPVILLDSIDLCIEPNEFVGLLGPSGAGKSLLMNALSGMRGPSSGKVFVNGMDLYSHIESLKQFIGYVPQDDIIHRELTVYETLYYIARLRLSEDVAAGDIEQIIKEVLDVSGLSHRSGVKVSQLSGGQRKRVSIAVELITKPSLIFLDEPTSGLDPATEEKIMRLFRQISESGRTVVLTTHSMENVRLFDKVVLLMAGKLIFYGRPADALTYFGVENFQAIYARLEAEAEKGAALSNTVSVNFYKESAERWKERYRATTFYKNYIGEKLQTTAKESSLETQSKQGHKKRSAAFHQFITLSRRYQTVFTRDRSNLFILLAQAPVIGFFTYLVTGNDTLRDFPYFILAIVSLWLGVSVSAREIVRERPVFKRERMVNLGLIPYIGSKLAVLSLVLFVQCLLLLGVLKIFHVTGQMYLPGYYGGLAHLLTMVLTGLVGIAMGLLVSCSVRSSETASSVVPLIMIPQIIFCGLVGEPKGVARAVGAIMPATWSFDLIKRQSTLETLTIGGGPVVELNKFITFLHPWGSLKRDPLILLMLFLTLITSALLLLRKQDRSGN